MNSMINNYIRDEVARQGYRIMTPEYRVRVRNMMDAWDVAFREHWLADKMLYPTLAQILYLGRLMEPLVNNGREFRGVDVHFEHTDDVSISHPPNAREVPGRMERLLAHIPNMTPNEFYVEFQLIHPFKDGNGRVGKILFNWLNGTLTDPIMPVTPWVVP